MFALFYVVLAPFVGAFADAFPKGRVMLYSNGIKVVGCLMMLFGTHPLMAYAIVGLGAAAYSPAKYGILTELLPAVAIGQGQWLDRGPDHCIHHSGRVAGRAIGQPHGVARTCCHLIFR